MSCRIQTVNWSNKTLFKLSQNITGYFLNVVRKITLLNFVNISLQNYNSRTFPVSPLLVTHSCIHMLARAPMYAPNSMCRSMTALCHKARTKGTFSNTVPTEGGKGWKLKEGVACSRTRVAAMAKQGSFMQRMLLGNLSNADYNKGVVSQASRCVGIDEHSTQGDNRGTGTLMIQHVTKYHALYMQGWVKCDSPPYTLLS